MERKEWLMHMRTISEGLYDRISPQYWDTFGMDENETHRAFLQKFLEQVTSGGAVLSAACGAGRYDGFLLDAGHRVVGIDQSEGMLTRAREHFPKVQYIKMGLQELNFHDEFDGAICMDAMEHVCPEDYPGILHSLQEALKPGCVLYFTADRAEEPDFDLEAHYQRAKTLGLPVVFGEVADEVETAYQQAMKLPEVSGELSDIAVYHYYPPLEQVRSWIGQAGLAIEAEGAGSGFHHFIVKKINQG